MLFNPHWDKTPSVAGFKLWLLQQNPNRIFNYTDCNKCAVGQYLASLGKRWYETPEARELNSFPMAACVRRNGRAYLTFGDVLQEMRQAGV